MTSIVAVCNRALSKIGDELIILSLDDNTKPARYCKALYADTRDFVQRYVLAPLRDKPLFGYEYQFSLPSDCLRVWKMEENQRYQVEGQCLLTDSNVCRFIGITRIEDATVFDPMFVEAFALRLAAELAVPLTASVALRDSLIKEYQQFVQQAKTASAMEGVQDVFVPQGWVEARF